MSFHRSVTALSFSFLLCGISSAQARSEAVSYLVLKQPVPQFFEQLERDTGVHFDVSGSIPGTIIDKRLAGNVETIVAQLSRQFGFHWFTFNDTIYISPASDSRIRLVRLNQVSSADARRALKEVGLTDDRFPITDAANGKALALTGPAKRLGLSEAIIESLAPETPDKDEVVAMPAVAPTVVTAPSAPYQAKQKIPSLVLYRGTSKHTIQ